MSTETGYYISNLPCDPEQLLRTARVHWKIERMHWFLDVLWNEDDSGILSHNGLKTLNSFRKLILLAHKAFVATLPKKKSVKGNVLAALINDDVCAAVLGCL